MTKVWEKSSSFSTSTHPILSTLPSHNVLIPHRSMWAASRIRDRYYTVGFWIDRISFLFDQNITESSCPLSFTRNFSKRTGTESKLHSISNPQTVAGYFRGNFWIHLSIATQKGLAATFLPDGTWFNMLVLASRRLVYTSIVDAYQVGLHVLARGGQKSSSSTLYPE